jgi:hypothetical protein
MNLENEKEKGQANDIIRELSEKAKENLRKNEDLKERKSILKHTTW